jgi:hypothetical protein
VGVSRTELRQEYEAFVPHDLKKREVGPPGPRLAQIHQLLEDRTRAGREVARSLEPHEIGGLATRRGQGGGKRLALLLGPTLAAEGLQFQPQSVPEREEVAHVLGGVPLLSRLEGPARPVASLHVLREANAQVVLKERLKAELDPPAEARRRVGVEDRRKLEAEVALQERDVVLCGMQHLFDRGTRQDRAQRSEVAENERVDQTHRSARVGDLENADLPIIVVEAVGFGVDRERGGALERTGEIGQLFWGADPAEGGVDRSSIGRRTAGVKVGEGGIFVPPRGDQVFRSANRSERELIQ